MRAILVLRIVSPLDDEVYPEVFLNVDFEGYASDTLVREAERLCTKAMSKAADAREAGLLNFWRLVTSESER